MAIATLTGFSALSKTRPVDNRLLLTAPLRAVLASTTSYVASNHLYVGQGEKVTFQFALVWADSTSTEWYIEWSPDATTWYRSLNLSAAAGVNTATLNNQSLASGASATWEDSVYVQDVYVRVAVKKTGGVGADTLGVTATILGL